MLGAARVKKTSSSLGVGETDSDAGKLDSRLLERAVTQGEVAAEFRAKRLRERDPRYKLQDAKSCLPRFPQRYTRSGKTQLLS